EFLEHFVRMLTLLGWRRDDLAWRAGQLHRLSDKSLFAAVRPSGALCDADVLDLLVSEHLVDRIDRTAWHAKRVEDIDPFGAAFVSRALVDFRVERIAVFHPQGASGIVRMLDQLRRFNCV